ncbi:Asp23/Gls24 family envelope stress response protein [Microbacterium sp. G2-8]|uniref:Asp23/Gls24 family envelope stress response protein n=1 Tax=Microbacterium sp. G2-8 TaxID=2842454 RepID=UPI001C896709|nr:Asp23/Gls24 family envelope stress response protein [Microbacterium sp. G2-8]
MANGSGAEKQIATPSSGRVEGGLAGKTTIDDGVVAKIAGIAAREVTGVYALGGGATRVVGAIRDALNSTDLGQGISVEVGEKQVAVDVTVMAEYPVSLQKVADDVRAAIYRAMQELVGMEVAEVNVTVNDVHIPSDDDDEERSQEARVR